MTSKKSTDCTVNSGGYQKLCIFNVLGFEKKNYLVDDPIFVRPLFDLFLLFNVFYQFSLEIRGTQQEYSSKPLKHRIVERILAFKR